MFTVDIFGSFSLFGRKMIIKWSWKWSQKWLLWMLQNANIENESKMHFTYLPQSSAHSNSTSNDLTKNFCTSSSSQWASISTFKSFVQVMGLHSKYHDVLLPTKYLQIRLQNLIWRILNDYLSETVLHFCWHPWSSSNTNWEPSSNFDDEDG